MENVVTIGGFVLSFIGLMLALYSRTDRLLTEIRDISGEQRDLLREMRDDFRR